MNVENKKQFATILLAVGLGLVSMFMTGQYIKGRVEGQTKALAKGYEKRIAAQEATLVQEMERRDRQLSKKIASLVKKQNEMASSNSSRQGPASVVVDSTVFAEVLPKGKRAMTVLIDSLSAVGGLINPGDFVDVIAHLDVPDYQSFQEVSNNITSVIMQNVQVLAVGSSFSPEGNALVYQKQQKSRELNITLALESEEAGLLTFAQRHGSLQLILRSPTEKEIEIMQVSSWDNLSDYVLEKQGTELVVPNARASLQDTGTKEVKPFIEIFRSGNSL